ncbi:MAG: 3-phosphoshikimate 1-carboxyvinyltransferase [Candidatus Hydrogenedentes bacterium]|nr:3-phosphoshikimate 1-carboxyvinyltransferase [Candidatus Hydrogenedentota bacterium]
MNSIAIHPRCNLDSLVTIPGSKSCTARALVMAGLTRGESVLRECADCDDSTYMIDGLRGLDVAITREGNTVTVGGGPFSRPDAPLFLGNSGTAVRFLAAACATLDGEAVIDGTGRMRERPIRDLIDAMRAWGMDAITETGCPPVRIVSRGTFGGETTVKGDASSQYLTGLLMVAPCADRGASIRIDGELVSKPYVDLTIAMMDERGVAVTNHEYSRFDVPSGQQYRSGDYAIEADASGASYFFAAAAVAGGRVRVDNLAPTSHQGDVHFPRVLEQMGCGVKEGPHWIEVFSQGPLRGIDVDLNAMPDMAQTLAVTALFADGPTRIRNVHNLRIKETDRIAATAAELRKLGATVHEHDDGLEIIPPNSPRPAAIDTYDDHRMAMSFSLAGLRIPGIVINDPACVSKTFPDFFERFGALR